MFREPQCSTASTFIITVYHLLSLSLLVERNLAPMRFRCNQEEILKLHTLGRRTLRELYALHLSEHECNCIPQLHACKMNANA